MPKSSTEPFAEAAVLKQLRHSGIPVIYDLEEDFHYYYLIEEYLDGESLYACLKREGSLTRAKRISYGIELCRILYYLHSFKAYPILYLDLQPHNLFICQGSLKLIDFDQAVSADLSVKEKRRFGTKGFAAPEQYREEALDVRTDIYAIGALLFYMGAGHPPDEAERLSLGRRGRMDLDAVMERCMQPDREHRYQSVTEVLEALLTLQAGPFTAMEMPLLTLAVVGSSHGMGATHVSFCAAAFFLKQGFSCLYQECNSSGAVRKMAGLQKQTPDSYGIYHWKKWAVRPQYGPNVLLEKPDYEVVIEDLGTRLQMVSEKDYDAILLLCGGKDWELSDSIASIRQLAGKKHLRVMFRHVSPDDILILPGDVTNFHLFYVPSLSLKEPAGTEEAFWKALFRNTPVGEVLAKKRAKRKPEKRGTAVCQWLRTLFTKDQERRNRLLGE